jgi:hypothetical protein
MKQLLSLLLAASIVVLTGCSKDDDEAPGATYMPNTANSSWTYDTRSYAPATTTGSYTVRATNKDTLIGSRTYRVYTHTGAGNDYYAQSGSDYYQLGTAASLGTQQVDLLYLKDADANSTWSESKVVTLNGIPLTVPLSSRITKKGYDTTINGKAYRDVVSVQTTLGTVNVLGTNVTPVSNVVNLYARGIGRIYSRSKVVINATVFGTAINVNVDDELLLNTYTIQ